MTCTPCFVSYFLCVYNKFTWQDPPIKISVFVLWSSGVFIFSFRLNTKQENKIRAQKTGTSPGVFLNQNMCCASAPGYLAALIHHAVNSAAPSARAIFRTLAPSRRGCLRTARHLGSFSCRLSITFENLFVNVSYVHRTNFRVAFAHYHFLLCDAGVTGLREGGRECRKCNAFGWKVVVAQWLFDPWKRGNTKTLLLWKCL